MNLYEINREILSCIDYETGEILDVQRLEMLEIAKEKKIENVALWIKNLESEAAALKKEKDSFAQREKSVKKQNRVFEEISRKCASRAEISDNKMRYFF